MVWFLYERLRGRSEEDWPHDFGKTVGNIFGKTTRVCVYVDFVVGYEHLCSLSFFV